MGVRTKRLVFVLVPVMVPVMLLVYWANTHSWSGLALADVHHLSTGSVSWPESGEWQRVKLPKKECRPAGSYPCFDHYKLTFAASQSRSALFVPQFAGSLRVALNGSEIHTEGHLTGSVENVRFRPFFVVLPQSALKPTANELQLTIASSRDTFHWLRPLYIGPVDELRRYASPIMWLLIDANQLVIGIYIMALMFCCLMLGYGKTNALYAWFAAFCFVSVARVSFFIFSSPNLEPILTAGYFLGSTLQMTSLAGLVAFLLWPERNAALVRMNYIVAIVVSVLLLVMLFVPVAIAAVLTFLTNIVFLIVSPFILYGLVSYWRLEQSWPSAWVLAFAVGSFTLTLHDVFHIVVLVENPLVQLSHVAPILMIAAFWLVVAEERLRYVNALYRAELDRLDALEIQRLELRRDLHDGVAAQMASLVMMARRKSPEFAPYLQENLDDLRRIMDDFDVESAGVREIIADVRDKLDRILAAHHVSTRWQIDIQEPAILSSQVRNALYLGVKECVHNALRHAHPSRIEFACATDGAKVYIDVRDDGVGMTDVDSVFELHRGLSGLQQRFVLLGGHMTLSSNNGTQVSFALPTQINDV